MPVTLYYFGRNEFNRGGVNWYERMDPRLLVLLDVFRHQWGAKVSISAHDAALGRELGPTKLSDHNVDLHGVCLAADVIPEGMTRRADAWRAVTTAAAVGFTAIGVYPDWLPGPGLHLGTRMSHRPGTPALWGAVRPEGGSQQYVALHSAVDQFSLA